MGGDFWVKIKVFLYLFEGTLTSVFKYKKSKRTQIVVVEIKVVTFFACWWKDPDPDLYKMTKKHMDITDPDPHYCLISGKNKKIFVDYNHIFVIKMTKNCMVLLQP